MKSIRESERRYDEVYLEEIARYDRLEEQIKEEMFGVRRQKPTGPPMGQGLTNGSNEQGSAPEAPNPNGEGPAYPGGEATPGAPGLQAPAGPAGNPATGAY